LIVAGGAVAVVAIAAGVWFGTRPPAPGLPPTAVAATPDKSALLKVQPNDHVLGDPNAPITVLEYASLTCPHCAHFQAEVLPKLKERYIAPGKVRLIYRDFPLDERAVAAAALAHCAGPERYFGFLDVLFQTQSSWAGADDYLSALKRLGKLGGLTDTQMDACLANQTLTDGILRSRLEAQDKYGVNSTPSFIIDGKTYSGSRDIDEFASLIDPLLGKS
jgi:protein-disulfide isomerase